MKIIKYPTQRVFLQLIRLFSIIIENKNREDLKRIVENIVITGDITNVRIVRTTKIDYR